MPLLRNRDDLVPRKYDVVWNGTIAKQQQVAQQRTAPPTKFVWKIMPTDEVDIVRHMRRLGTFTLADLDDSLDHEYSLASLQKLSYKLVKQSRLMRCVRNDGCQQRFKYLEQAKGQVNLFGSDL